MTTLIVVYNSDGCLGRCDARCHNAKHPECNCICGGMNHGKGSEQAAINTRLHGREMIEAWTKDHPDHANITAAFQISLF